MHWKSTFSILFLLSFAVFAIATPTPDVGAAELIGQLAPAEEKKEIQRWGKILKSEPLKPSEPDLCQDHRISPADAVPARDKPEGIKNIPKLGNGGGRGGGGGRRGRLQGAG